MYLFSKTLTVIWSAVQVLVEFIRNDDLKQDFWSAMSVSQQSIKVPSPAINCLRYETMSFLAGGKRLGIGCGHSNNNQPTTYNLRGTVWPSSPVVPQLSSTLYCRHSASTTSQWGVAVHHAHWRTISLAAAWLEDCEGKVVDGTNFTESLEFLPFHFPALAQ